MVSKLSDEKLLIKTHELVKIERKTLGEILTHLQEIFDRRLFADLGHSSMFKYLVKELRYSEGAAARRLKALRLVEKVPAVKKLIENGEINLTLAGKVESFASEKNKDETKKILNFVKNKSSKEAEVIMLELDETRFKEVLEKNKSAERRSVQANDTTRIHMTLKNETLEKLEKVKARFKLSSDEAIDYALNFTLNEYDKKLKKINKTKGKTVGRTIPAKVKKEVRDRANNTCEYPGCDEIYNLEFEHVTPFARGGKHEVSNLKLFCRAHNQRSAIKEFGKNFMKQFFIKTSPA